MAGAFTTFHCLMVFFIEYLFAKHGFGGHSHRVTSSFDQSLPEEKVKASLERFKPKIEGFEISHTPRAYTDIFRVVITMRDLEVLRDMIMGLDGVLKSRWNNQ
ncbi:MAG: hypothetical protein JW945_01055 [Methanomicrobia archaeon]|nr:hypothetical protein [Methanomicrobia archaeon]